jgi:homoserine kinase
MLTGLLGANGLLGDPLLPEEILALAARNEGHPDNIAPAVLGGLVAAIIKDERVIFRKFRAKPLAVTVVLPDFPFPTRLARAVLPSHIPRQDAIYNLGRVPLVLKALEEGDLDLLGEAMNDALHQPYRLPLIPGAQAAMDAARQAGAAAVALSGAGPSLIAFSAHPRPAIGQAMQRAFQQAGLGARVFHLRVSLQGAMARAWEHSGPWEFLARAFLAAGDAPWAESEGEPVRCRLGQVW